MSGCAGRRVHLRARGGASRGGRAYDAIAAGPSPRTRRSHATPRPLAEGSISAHAEEP